MKVNKQWDKFTYVKNPYQSLWMIYKSNTKIREREIKLTADQIVKIYFFNETYCPKSENWL